MHVIRDPMRAKDLPRGGVGTIGNFDGVHLGHRKILETVVARARAVDRPSFAITFEPLRSLIRFVASARYWRSPAQA